MAKHRIQFLGKTPINISLKGKGTVKIQQKESVSRDAEVRQATISQEQPRAPAPPEPDIRPLLESIQQSLLVLEEGRVQSLQEMQQVTVELAIAVASQMTFDAIQIDQFAVEALVAQAIDSMGVAGEIYLELHPADLDLLRRRLATAPTTWDLDQVELRANPTLSRGDCRAVSPDKHMVMSEVSTRIAEIRRHWMEELDDSQIERRRDASEGPPLRRFPDRRGTA